MRIRILASRKLKGIAARGVIAQLPPFQSNRLRHRTRLALTATGSAAATSVSADSVLSMSHRPPAAWPCPSTE